MARTAGRPPKPTAVHRLQGTFEPGRHAKRATVEWIPPTDLPEPPEWLSWQAAAIWRAILPSMVRGTVGGCDIHLMASYCEQAATHQRAIAAQKVLDEGKDLPFLTRGKDGAAVVSPYVRVIRQSANAMAQLGSDLGIGPTARARIGSMLLGPTPAQTTEVEDPWSAFEIIQGGKRQA